MVGSQSVKETKPAALLAWLVPVEIPGWREIEREFEAWRGKRGDAGRERQNSPLETMIQSQQAKIMGADN